MGCLFEQCNLLCPVGVQILQRDIQEVGPTRSCSACDEEGGHGPGGGGGLTGLGAAGGAVHRGRD